MQRHKDHDQRQFARLDARPTCGVQDQLKKGSKISYKRITYCSRLDIMTQHSNGIHAFFILAFIITIATVRLEGPLSKNGTGRLEVFYNGTWGTICDDSWNINAAKVACRQLGYNYSLGVLTGSNVPDGSGQIWLDDVKCEGNETDLEDCTHNGWGKEDCSHSEDVGVECSAAG